MTHISIIYQSWHLECVLMSDTSSDELILMTRHLMPKTREHWTKISWVLVLSRLINWWNWLASRSLKQVWEAPSFSDCRFWYLPPVYRVHPPSEGRKILVACGPGNNGKWYRWHNSFSKTHRYRWRRTCCRSSSLALRISSDRFLP